MNPFCGTTIKWAVAALFLIPTVGADVDVFGITRMMPSKWPLQEWNSAHWAEGGKRTMNPGDPRDSTGWSLKRGDGNLMEIDGAGMLRMGGNQPRIYFQGTAERPVFFRDVEFTGYFRRVGTDGATNGGFNMGVRSSVNGHGDVDHCLANTYYLGFRYPGTWVFYKELDHPNGATGASGRLIAGGGDMPAGKWIGMKYLSYNIPGRENAVKLEAYVDTVTGGDVRGTGGVWKKAAEIIDDGNWTAPTGTCGYDGKTVVTKGGGVVFIRNTSAAEAQYKLISIREIVPSGPVHAWTPAFPHKAKASWGAGHRSIRLMNLGSAGTVRISDLAGRRIAGGSCTGSGACTIDLPSIWRQMTVISGEALGKESRLLLEPACLGGD